jgi:hypothetical protein
MERHAPLLDHLIYKKNILLIYLSNLLKKFLLAEI